MYADKLQYQYTSYPLYCSQGNDYEPAAKRPFRKTPGAEKRERRLQEINNNIQVAGPINNLTNKHDPRVS